MELDSRNDQRRTTMNRNRVFAFLILATAAGYWVAQAGSLEPSGPPAPTMQSLAELQRNWNKEITTSARFELILGDAAVLDHETGLVWDKTPQSLHYDWFSAAIHCTLRQVGTRLGWRLPTIEELASLVEPGGAGGPTLPFDHPFVLPGLSPPPGDQYWSISTYPDPTGDTSSSWRVSFLTGVISADAKPSDARAWCVRGGKGYDYAGQM
jgi:hypothetical protein